MYNREPIKSRDNANLRFARRVRDGKESAYILVEGSRLSGEALTSGLSVRSCFISETFRPSASLASILMSRNLESYVVSESLLGSISDTKTPQGIVLIAERPREKRLDDLFSDPVTASQLPLWIFLNEVNNPSNLGAVVRTAEAAGARGILVSKHSADPFSPKALRASMGSAFRVPIVDGVELKKHLKMIKENKIRITAVDKDGGSSYLDVDWLAPRLLIFGSEAEGLHEDVLSLADETIKITTQASVESLNLAVSSGVILFEAKRQSEN